MNRYSPTERTEQHQERADKPATASALGLCLMGFLLLLSGVLMFILTTVNAFSSNEGTKTMVSVLICLAMYRAGKFLLQQVSKFKMPPNRRRSVIS
ncbi:hypothetical protein EXU34_08705 [Alteromonas sp. ZYF713]|jgi:lipopolysaccharide export LptBFGC system permease protein LptF|uniref:hypothetical protein n=1 Tax=Alteromonas alba TaxID=2079529 RepID=UPI000EDD5F9F|nr:hypothetical protein [Alteromonas alba]MDG6097522.1 hypothetical protein [Alteromonas sp. ZYF713]HCA76467.1 hypothetical protein [Alteromonas sp.]|tara:strand:- start:2627 stop:2914 length:288 start_codon:yes stop_codon:yes gene_type:complete